MQPTATIHLGDNRDILKTIETNSIDSVVTDPPYELGFMGKAWDASGIAYQVTLWAEVLRVLKPGGHLLAFGGTRTYHRMAVAIEDAGFEIRDSIHWIYGSGFPKSLDVSKAIDKVNGEANRLHKFTAWMRTSGLSQRKCAELIRPFAKNDATASAMAQHYYSDKQQPAIPTAALWAVIRPLCGDVPEWVDQLVARIEAEREVVGVQTVNGEEGTAGGYANGIASIRGSDITTQREINITIPATDAARQWQGWGTALKPAHEPIVVARKPLEGTVAANVLKYGTGALNIDGCRVAASAEDFAKLSAGVDAIRKRGGSMENSWKNSSDLSGASPANPAGRWPANVIHDGSDEIVGMFPFAQGMKKAILKRGATTNRSIGGEFTYGSEQPLHVSEQGYSDPGSAARFFYAAKASRAERNAENTTTNTHPTVKPLALMRYLLKLVTPPGGTTLDPFAGSGTTLVAAIHENLNSIGIELTPEYHPIIQARINHAQNTRQTTTQPGILDPCAS